MSAPAHALRNDEGSSYAETRAPRVASIESARAFLRATLLEVPHEGVLAITVPAPVAPVEAPLRALRKGTTWVFAPSEGVSVAAIGVAREARASGETRFVEARAACEAMLGHVVHRVDAGALTIPVRAFVGFAFAAGTACATPWEAFGDALVTLPRWTYASDGTRASLTLVIDIARGIDERLAIAELEAAYGAIETARREPSAAATIVRADHLDAARWARSIEAIRSAIERGDARKIVAARRSVITTNNDIEPLDVLTRLGETRGPTTRFMARVGSATFLGATPEHLFVQRGTRIATEALAGSIAADAERGSERLVASAKDREEHAYVVRHIVERLAPLCARVAHPDAPQVRRLPTVMHLRTPIEAELAKPTHPIDVIAALHPTPAVGGTPVEHAVPWIVQHETERGWYGAPFGWIDARGDAEFVVALRCGVIQGARAWLWAGGGIVEGSDAQAEWDETALKMRPMLRALGAVR
ncbi:isochorismate synthase [Sandaracinus amylolyticus]|uniref:isochorismate synthase n=1 Tax=Sandaracinus amylolyticus TaxID=927083 RepID=UPI001F0037B8|nr:isochorismate synthase [Sandaracinus amylolyticus]UJR85067.1 Hypothetical protein I5071_71460 [Sandaracinus amylolyticus]